MNAYYLTIISAIFLSIDQVLIKVLVDNLKVINLTNLFNIKIILLSVLIGFLGLIGVGCWLFALQKADLTKIYWLTSLSLFFVPLFSLFILRESFSINQFIGYIILTFGAVIISRQ